MAEPDGVVPLAHSLKGFFDESERTEGQEPLVVAGAVFYPGRYRRFAREWRRMLRTAPGGPFTHLHMTNLYAGKREYDGLGDRRGEILGAAVDLINDHTTLAVSVVIDQAEFERLAPAWYAELHGSIYTTACQMGMRATSFHLSEFGISRPVDYEFERGHRFASEAEAVLREIRNLPVENEEGYHYGSHAFTDKKSEPGLQAADLLAWTIARAHVHFPTNRTVQLFRPHLLRLGRDLNRFKVQLMTGDKLSRFMEEQVERPRHYFFKRPMEMRDRLR